ncbi:hypothetical protein EYF80_015987 [Liparis tanakae]|uniref:Uncharacterized protein n=1 Tax=Liparis tanakae TaxID=230148 RepID=A0A4Z2I6U0_9TELE|nr:hypothetical protein EYF80_015987 [Liparis tanakae]
MQYCKPEADAVVGIRGQGVDGLVVDVVAVAEVQLGQRGHVAYDEAQRRVGDVQACQAKSLNPLDIQSSQKRTAGGAESRDRHPGAP